MDAASILTLKQALAVPTAGSLTFTFYDFFIGKGDDLVVLEAWKDNGATWEKINGAARSALAPDAALALESEPMTRREFDLAPYKGKSIKIRFQYKAGAENRAGSTRMVR